jgi:outer membrane protein assembly factor BamA
MHRSLTGIICSLTLVVFPVRVGLLGQAGASASSECAQPTEVQNAIIREAERNRYITRRLEFIGNQYTRDSVLRRRTNIGLQEGDLFTRRNLIRSLRNVSTLREIYPVKTTDVTLHLNPADETVDLIICFKERESRNAKRAS